MAKTIRSSGHEALRDALVAARKATGLTQEQLAVRLKCHQSFVARVESGERRIDVIELIVLARAMEVDASTLLAKAEGAMDADHRI
ncbi:helix-turn-helix protein [Marinovum algicola]|uniref:Helix-turn-helix n=1 Tax=Marinovum algicola TaxID=42444 RepID=A0A975WBU4_9RHOB|nr:helix-turn-helix transcriptional regulator [Marinovum algicola]SEJ82341.1 Helix-turn-helix [Marinovum algicola]SLN63030.1 helix-turn-helix protein [Marinovum algicola]